MTTLNAIVISIRLVVSLFIQRLLAELVGESGIAKIGQLRNVNQLLTSVSSGGVFNGIVKYVSEYKEDKEQLQKLFSTTTVFTLIGTVVSSSVLLIGATGISNYLFGSDEFIYLIQLIAVIVPFISLYRVFNGVVNGLSMYKKFAKIDLISYLLSAGLLIYFLIEFNLHGALIAIVITPLIQLSILLIIFFKTLKDYVRFKKLNFRTPMLKGLLAFSLMSFFSTVLLNFVEIDIRTMITNRITEDDAGIWTAMTNISKNYMVFSISIFSLYVLPKFASIHTRIGFVKELLSIYKTLLPIFGLGMILVYFLRDYVIMIIYPDFLGMEPLFKWQLLGDFVRLASLVLMHQFLAKKLVRSFIFSELLSLGMFYILSQILVGNYGVEGVVMAHFFRYVVYLVVVFTLVIRYFNKQKKQKSIE
jgi:PST family polysaccharide transporter